MDYILEEDFGSELKEQINEARFHVTMASSITAYMMFKSEIKFIKNHQQIKTAGAIHKANEKPVVLIDVDFWRSLGCNKERAFLIGHELDHIFLSHIQRMREKDYNQERFNRAADYYINLRYSGVYLNSDGYKSVDEKFSKNMKRPECGLFSEEYIGMSADEIYERLDDSTDDESQKGQMTLEDLGDFEIDCSDDAKSQRDRVVSGAIQSAKDSKSIGESESQMVNEIDEYFKPVVDYRDILDVAISTSSKELTTYKKPSFLTQGDIVFPSRNGETINVVFGSDTSGSMSPKDYEDVMSALSGILLQFDDWTIDLVTCDTSIHHIGEYTADEADDMPTGTDIKFVGGGGTDMSPIAEYGKTKHQQGDEIDACIILTDGFIPESVDDFFEPAIKNIVIVTASGNKNLQLENAEVIFIND